MKKFIWSTIIVIIALLFIRGCVGRNKTGCDCEESKTIQKTFTLSSDTPSGALSVYEETGDFFADAGCHAKMKLTFYWQNPDLKQTEERPPVNYTFEAGMGYFPANDYISGNASSGFTWQAESDQAQDKDKPEGTNYAIVINYDSSTHPNENVVCELSITYKVYDMNAYDEGCGE